MPIFLIQAYLVVLWFSLLCLIDPVFSLLTKGSWLTLLWSLLHCGGLEGSPSVSEVCLPCEHCSMKWIQISFVILMAAERSWRASATEGSLWGQTAWGHGRVSTLASFKTQGEGVSFSFITCEVLMVPVSWEDEMTCKMLQREPSVPWVLCRQW